MVDKTKSGSKKKPTKVFGSMTKRRWFAVAIFLCGITWSYTAGPPLSTMYVANEYFRDPVPYDWSTVSRDGDLGLIDKIFKPSFWENLWITQAAAHYGTIASLLWFNDHLLLSDMEKNCIFSYTPITGTQVAVKNFDNIAKVNEKNLLYPGPSGLLLHPKQSNLLYIAHQGSRSIILYDTKTKKSKVVASHYQDKKLNSPRDLILSPDNKYIYFTDPPFGLIEKNNKENKQINTRGSKTYIDSKSEIKSFGIYRIPVEKDLNSNNKENVELLDSSLQRPNYLLLSKNKKLLYVSNCIEDEFEIHVFDVDNNKNEIKLKEIWDEKKILQNNKNKFNLKNNKGCVGGMALHSKGYILAACYGNKICILNEQTGKLESIVKLADGAYLQDISIVSNINARSNYTNVVKPMLFIASNYSMWEMKLQAL